MPWAKVGDEFPLHPKTLQAGPMAAWLYVCGLCYCKRYLTDGFIPEPVVPSIGLTDAPMAAAYSLVKVGLWVRVQGGYQVHDYRDHNWTKDQVREHQAKQKKRIDEWRKQRQKKRPANAAVADHVTPSVTPFVTDPVTDLVTHSENGPLVLVPVPVLDQVQVPEKRQEPSSGKSRRVGTKKSQVGLVVAKTPNDQRFELFWSLHWPKTRRVGKKNAKREWDKLGVDDALFDKMAAALAVMSASTSWTKEGGHYIPHPERWLKNRRFDDDLAAYRVGSVEDANQALMDERYGQDPAKALDDGQTIDADFWPTDDDEGGGHD